MTLNSTFMASVKSIYTLAACLLCAAVVNAAEYTVSLPHYHANAGETLRLPIQLNNATGLTDFKVQINFDQQVATFKKLVDGDLGRLSADGSAADLDRFFELDYELNSGSLTITGLRARALTSAGGTLAWVEFLLTPGATKDAYTDLAIAVFEVGDETGVTDLAATNIVCGVGGSIWLTSNSNIDNSGNRLPDWWERSYGLDPYSAEPEQDDEGDGLNLLQEYAFGGSPLINDAASIRGNLYFDASDYFVFTFRRRNDDADVKYKLLESANLQEWDLVEQGDRIVGPVVDRGAGIEEVSIRSQLPFSDPGAPSKLFMRLEVDFLTAD
jgi:hypothetical protein